MTAATMEARVGAGRPAVRRRVSSERKAAGREPAAAGPPESRGLARDEVRLMVAGPTGVEHVRFRELPRFLRPGDVLVVNTSATLPAAVDGVATASVVRDSIVRDRGVEDGRRVTVHFSTALGDGSWAVEVRPRGRATGPIRDLEAGDRIAFPDGSILTLGAPYPDPELESPRLRRATLSGSPVPALLRHHGRPITYAYVTGRWPLESYQTVFARHPGSAEMPSAGRPFTDRLVTSLVTRGIAFAPLLLHTGVSSLEPGEAPLPERYRVGRIAADRVNGARSSGGRVIAVGTTAARALESATSEAGRVVPRAGWTELVLGPDRPTRVVDGIVTGWHARGASHLDLLDAVAGPERVAEAYREASFGDYLWHEFGDSCLLLGDRP